MGTVAADEDIVREVGAIGLNGMNIADDADGQPSIAAPAYARLASQQIFSVLCTPYGSTL